MKNVIIVDKINHNIIELREEGSFRRGLKVGHFSGGLCFSNSTLSSLPTTLLPLSFSELVASFPSVLAAGQSRWSRRCHRRTQTVRKRGGTVSITDVKVGVAELLLHHSGSSSSE